MSAATGEAAPGIPDARDVTIKAAEAEDKMLYVAGDAPPGTLVRVYADEELVGEARTDINGVWLLEAAEGRARRRGRLPRGSRA